MSTKIANLQALKAVQSDALGAYIHTAGRHTADYSSDPPTLLLSPPSLLMPTAEIAKFYDMPSVNLPTFLVTVSTQRVLKPPLRL